MLEDTSNQMVWLGLTGQVARSMSKRPPSKSPAQDEGKEGWVYPTSQIGRQTGGWPGFFLQAGQGARGSPPDGPPDPP